MATSPSNQPIRSISLPSRPHPLVPRIDEHLSRLTSLDSEVEVSSTSESQISSLGHKLNNLKELYDVLVDFILLPQNQQKLVQLSVAKCVDELIDGSLKLLDVCGNVNDVLSQTKEHTQEIQSSLRRRSNGELSIGDEVIAYMNMRKKTKMVCKKCLKDVKGMTKKSISLGEVENDENFATIDVLRKVEGVTAAIFESLLEVISGTKAQTHKRSASLSIIMCKLILHQNIDIETEEEVCVNEFDDVDSSLSSLTISQKRRICINGFQAEILRGKMVKLDSSVQDLEEVLEGLFRCLVRSRATLLNILSQ
ncbi:uncharacterized protein LOC141648235 [Silene latifolia]|uniref:uncharacterized protein LOC141648235 n=1 Tax=Silene latifolia TaxID=37657 RepID=UPI003D76A735